MRQLQPSMLIPLMLLAACGAPSPAPEPGVVARIDTVRIHAKDVQSFAARVSADGDLDSQRQSYLRGLMARHLLEREARSQGLDTLSKVVLRAEAQLHERVRERYRRGVLWSGLQITDAEVEAYFDSLGLKQQRRIFGILLETRDRAEAAAADLAKGRDFAEVARQYSTHRPSAQQGGELGFISVSQARSLEIPDSVFHHLPDGDNSPILVQGARFQVLRFDGRREAEVDQHRTHLRNVIKTGRYNRLLQEKAAKLAVESNWQTVDAGLRALENLDRETFQPWQLSREQSATPLFSYDGGEITVGQYVLGLVGSAHPVPTDQVGPLVAEVAERIRTKVLFLAAARQAGLGETADDLIWHQGLVTELAITELRRRVMSDVTRPTVEDARQFYDRYPDVFRDADQMVIIEAFVDSLEQAEAVVVAVRQGGALKDIAAELTGRGESLWQARGVLRLGHKERLQMPELYEAASQAEVGQLTGPIAVHDGYSVFEVIDHQRGTLAEFVRVERRATGMAAKQMQTEHFEAFVDRLLDKYEDVVSVYPEELVRALPDSLLNRISAG